MNHCPSKVRGSYLPGLIRFMATARSGAIALKPPGSGFDTTSCWTLLLDRCAWFLFGTASRKVQTSPRTSQTVHLVAATLMVQRDLRLRHGSHGLIARRGLLLESIECSFCIYVMSRVVQEGLVCREVVKGSYESRAEEVVKVVSLTS
jgi:hypothetical protein